jgi:hypothetical protein
LYTQEILRELRRQRWARSGAPLLLAGFGIGVVLLSMAVLLQIGISTGLCPVIPKRNTPQYAAKKQNTAPPTAAARPHR